MSHRCVLVVGEDLEGLLAPFDEHADVVPYADPWVDVLAQRCAAHAELDFVGPLDPYEEAWLLAKFLPDHLVNYAPSTGFTVETTRNPQGLWVDWIEGGRHAGKLPLLSPSAEGVTSAQRQMVDTKAINPADFDGIVRIPPRGPSEPEHLSSFETSDAAAWAATVRAALAEIGPLERMTVVEWHL